MSSLFWRPTPTSTEHVFWHRQHSICYFPDYVGYRIYTATGELLSCASTIPIALAWLDNLLLHEASD